MSGHAWLYHPIIGGVQVVSCRRCGKWDSYRLVEYKPEPPRSECNPPEPQWTIPLSLLGRAGS